MLDLSPTKLLIIFIVVIVLLGPNRLPQVARQLGAGWRRLREVQERVDREVRQSIPELPSSADIVRFARSPVTLLDQFAHAPVERDAPVEDPAAPAAADGATGDEAGGNGINRAAHHGSAATVGADDGTDTDRATAEVGGDGRWPQDRGAAGDADGAGSLGGVRGDAHGLTPAPAPAVRRTAAWDPAPSLPPYDDPSMN